MCVMYNVYTIEFVHQGIEFTCIIYYSEEFEMLRRQCNINQLMIESLCRCQTWSASGGKSKSHFYKTQGHYSTFLFLFSLLLTKVRVGNRR